MQVYTVGAVTRYLKELLDSDSILQDIWIAGEISNLTVSSAGHAYFTLKDTASQLRCVIFRNRLALVHFPLAQGSAVIAHGRLSVYEPHGQYQLSVDLLQPEGVGTLHLQFELLRTRLEQEGLFDQARKRPIPAFPKRIGVVTSSTGAVLHDIVTILQRRYPLAELILAPSLVQGAQAADQICRAIAALNDFDGIDVMIVARGGGSLEELWPFNEEAVARAIFASHIPVICGIGHETDFTIADFVADLRAATPSAAAELVAPDLRTCRTQVVDWNHDLIRFYDKHMSEMRAKIDHLGLTLQRFSPQALLDLRRQRTDDYALRARACLEHYLTLWRAQVDGQAAQLGSLDPTAVLRRGYSICRRYGDVVSSIQQVSLGDPVTVQVSDGTFETAVDGFTEVES